MSAELNNEQAQPGYSEADDYAAAFDEAAEGRKDPSQDEESGSWVPEEEAPEPPKEAAELKEEKYTPETTDQDAPPDELKDHPYYKSMKGRIDQQRRRADDAEARLRAMESEKSRPQQQQAQPPVFERAEIPEDLKEDIEAFKKAYPEYSDVIEMKGKTGDRIRKLLSDYGGEVAAVQADNFLLKSEVRESRSAISQQIGNFVGLTHEQQIYAAHPDFAQQDPSQKKAFFEEMEEWIDSLPRIKGNEARRVFDGGSTKETIQLFSEFKASRRATTQTTQNNKRRQVIDDGLAVPSSARSLIRKPPARGSDDYAGAFEEACAS